MNKLKYFYLFYLLFFSFSCQRAPSPNTKSKILEISKATYKGKPMIGDRSLFIETLSNPISKLDTCNRTRIGYTQGYWIYDCITPKDNQNATYSTYKNVVFLSRLNFSSSSEKILTPNLTLSNQTTLDEIIKLFPDSYPQVYKDKAPSNRKNLEKIYINDDLSIEKRLGYNHLELQFKNNYLSTLIYFWKPEMTDAQISKARKIYREVEEREK